jgi:hypothetical protein
VNEAAQVRFEWGVFDCCAFCARVAKRVSNRSFELPKYVSREEAEKLITEAGGLRALVGDVTDLEPTDDVTAAMDGSPVLARIECGETLGVRLGDRIVFKTARGLAWLPIDDPGVVCAWPL